MKKKILSIVLAIVMVISLLPTVALADGEPDVSTWAKLQAAIDEADGSSGTPAESATIITLTQSLTATSSDSAITIPEGKKIILDLNGFVLDRGLISSSGSVTHYINGSVIEVYGELIIQDSNTGNKTHKFKKLTSGLWVLDETSGTETVTGGVITGGTGYKRNSDYYGGGVYVYESVSFTMSGGSISGNAASAGGGVFGDYLSAFTMSGGTVSGNSASSSGGGVYVYGTFTMTGGAISGNTANSSGGVLSYGKFTMSGGSISGNTATKCGGVDVGSEFTMTGGEITGNTASYYGGLYMSGTITLGGTAKVTGNKTTSGDASNVYLSSGDAITLGTDTSTPKTGMSIGVSAEVTPVNITKTASSDDEKYFFSDKASLCVKFVTDHLELCKNEAYVPDVSTWAKLQVAIDEADSSDTIKLTQNLTATSSDSAITIPKGKKIILDLNGFVLDRGLIASDGTVTKNVHGSVIEVYGELTVKDSNTGNKTHKFKKLTSDDNKGLWVLDETSGTETVTGGVITGGTGYKQIGSSYYGGGVNVSDGGKLTVSGGNISGNVASDGEGGGVYVYELSTFTMTGGSISGNVAIFGGGVNVSDGGSFTMSSGSISGNTANSGGGGGVYVCELSTFTMTGGSISGNVAVYGGGVYVYSSSFTMSGGEVSGNTASGGCGGGIQVSYGNLAMTGGKVSGNTAGTCGGGVYVYGTFTISGGDVCDNTALNGGGVCVDYGNATMSGGTISGNTASTYGGVYFSGSSSKFTMTGGEISGNTAGRYGGVYVDYGTFTLGGTAKITGNKTTSGYASNVCLPNGKSITLGTGTSAPAAGMSVGVTVAVSPSAITSNGTANDAEYFSADRGFQSVKFNSDHLELCRNETYVPDVSTWAKLQTAIDETDGDYDVPATTATTITLTQNLTATSADSAIEIPEGKKIILDLNGFILNRGLISSRGEAANNDRGSVIVVSSELTIQDSNTGNRTHKFKKVTYGNVKNLWVLDETNGTETVTGGVITGGSADYGGGVSGRFTMNGGTICGNAADVGGGVHIGNGTLTITDGAICGNIAIGEGGGVYCQWDAYGVSMSGGEISGNSAKNGGGVYLNSNTFTMTGGTISGNSASNNGGGVSGSVTMTDGEISSNTAGGKGGGVFGNTKISGGKIIGNTAKSGGGLYICRDGGSNLSGGEISGNTASTTGGGVYVEGFTLAVSDGKIDGNTAGTDGGGVYVSGGELVITGGKITNNTAKNGGGAYSGYITVSAGEISGNTATTAGGGVYAADTVIVGGTAKITGNKNGSDAASNVYLPSGKYVTIGSGIGGRYGDGVDVPAAGMSVGVTTEIAPTASTPVAITANGSEDYVQYFFADNTAQSVAFNTDHLELHGDDSNPVPQTIEKPADVTWKYGEKTSISLGFTNTSSGGGALTYTSSNTDVATVTKTSAGCTVTLVGAGEATITATAAAVSGKYTETTASVKVTVTKASLTVTAKDKSIKYGEMAEDFEYTVTGLVSGDTASGAVTGTASYTCDYKQYDKVGDYDVTPSGLTAKNYDITFKKGKLTVDKAETYTITLDESTLIQSLDELTDVTATIEPKDTTAKFKVEYKIDGSWKTSLPTKAGDYSVRASLTSSDNIKVPTSAKYAEGTLKVSSEAVIGSNGVPVEIKTNDDGTVEISALTSEQTEEIIKYAYEHDKNVTLDITGSKTASSADGLVIPASIVDAVNDSVYVNTLTVKMPDAEIKMDSKVMETLADVLDENSKLTVKIDIVDVSDLNASQKSAIQSIDRADDIVVLSLNMTAMHYDDDGRGIGKTDIHELGGKTEVKVEYDFDGAYGKKIVVIYVDDTGKTTYLPATYKDGYVSFTTDHFSVFAVTAEKDKKENPFTDVKETDFFYDAVLWAVDTDITYGTTATTFSPTALCSRAEVVTFLWRAAGSPTPTGSSAKFKDVKSGSYYEKAVAWAVEKGITAGTSADTFSPDMRCSRGQIVTFLARFAGVKDTNTRSSFTDVKSTDYYAAAVQWAKENGVTAGTTATTFSPDRTCTRGEVVTFLYRWMVK